ncbi:PilC/PilY family type IV pilus protein [Pseudomonas sp. RIT-PI-AD]|uniref:pilus assembly protein n=1 Tax=Pseudomonas sp. RIT-PI-AD TaxID=3035294 RepID=UPI0021D9A2A3|nr:PilC/PilY family type IV pilus protein [Pseudomonas sp. RIT-PI-AD]
MRNKITTLLPGFIGFFLTLGIPQAQATLLDISQKPLVLSDSVAPNLILTLDDSGSMRWAFVPDDISGVGATRRAKSADFNPMYYNPDVTYQVPIKFNSDGSPATTSYSSSFTQAWNNGFNASSTTGSLNLSNNYQVGWSYDPTGGIGSTYGYSNTSTRLAQNPAADFTLTTTRTGSQTSASGITFNVTDTSSRYTASCTATATNFQTPSCSKSGSTFTVNLTQMGGPAYYYVYDQSQSGCTRSNADDNCYRLVFVTSTSGTLRADDTSAGKDERTNFAIWYSFYRVRSLATLSAANLAFNGLPTSIRLTWQTLGNCASLTGSCNSNYFRRFTTYHRGNFFNWLPTIKFDQGTNLHAAMKRAGDFLATEEPWYYDPNPLTSTGGRGTSVQSPIYGCRPSFHVMMTDGMWNANSITVGNTDGSSVSLPDNTSYAARTPFKDSTENTLADLAFKYWYTDARSGLANLVKPTVTAPNTDPDKRYWDPRNDPATWQHMVNFTIGLGLGSSLNNSSIPWTGETYGGAGYEALKAGTASWPKAEANSSNNVYDLWHAAVNSRGEFFNGDSPDKVVQAFSDILNRIGNYTTSASRPSVSASQVSGANAYEVYETEFSSDDWSGDLKKYSLNSSGSRSLSWSAKSKLTAARTVKMAAASGSKLQDFTWGNLTDAQKAYFNINPDSTGSATDNRGEDRVNYVRGERSKEGLNSGSLRQRNSVLGDIVNSSPVLVSGAQYLAYLADKVDGSAGAYKAYQEQQAKRTSMVYVGANDGMLHGFKAGTSADAGTEAFAFIPTAVMPNLYRLSGQNYQSGGHRYYVDGTPVVSDVYYSGAWHTVLIGTLRGGGRSLFALDVTDPTSIKLLWEFTHDDLGYSFPQPTVARLHTGKWAVVVGNGYGNQTGAAADKAALFVIDVQNGTLVKEVVVTGDATKANGLSSTRLADNNSDGIADYAYAGDLQGNLWRFDLFSPKSTASADPFASSVIGTATAADIKASYNGKPLFTAVDSTNGAAQPITAPPSLVRHPTQLGYLVIFGTGKYFEGTDGNVNTTRAQSVYAIWDRKTKAEVTGNPPTITRSSLLNQTITTQANANINGTTNEIRLVSESKPTWYKANATPLTADSSVNQWGWLMDLQVGSTKAGEMLINPMAARGQVLLFSTLTPNNDPCKDGVETWLYGINPYSGARTTFSVFDLDGSDKVDSKDTYNSAVVSSRKLSSPGGFTLSGDQLFSSGEDTKVYYGPNSSGRQSWQVIPEEEN